MELQRKLTHILGDQIPDYIAEYYPLYVIFMTKYFEYLDNSSTGVQWTIQNIELNRDIDTTASSLAVQFLNTYVPNLPNESAVDDTILVKYFKECFKNKGNEKSFRFFFKAFFNDDVQITYPRDVMFKTSDGEWYIERSLLVRSNVGNPENLKHSWVTGLTSTASAVVNDVVKVSGQSGNNAYNLILQAGTLAGTFSSGESIRGIAYEFSTSTAISVTSTVTVSSLGIVITKDGVYRNSNSQLSFNQVLQDSVYYQNFSYVIKSSQDRKSWADHILKQLHPSGTVMFNDMSVKTAPSNSLSSFGTSVVIETAVALPTTLDFLTASTYTFDRTADLETGTSTTQRATTTGFATVTYTSVGSIAYSATYDYPGEHITFALQSFLDSYTGSDIREVTRYDGPSWDKYAQYVDLESKLIAYNYDVNSSLVTTRFIATSSITAGGTALASISSGVLTYNLPETSSSATSVGSMIMLITYGKNSRGNVSGEEDNVISINLSSNATFIPYFDDQTQVLCKDIALGSSLNFNGLTYFHSSNSIQFTVQTPGSVSASSSTGLLTGTGTSFFTTFKEGDYVCIDNFTTTYTITNLYSNTSLLVSPHPVSNYASSVLYHASPSGVPVSSATYIGNSRAMLRFKPYNGQRGSSYDRFAVRIALDAEKQFTTSIAETFASANITSTGLIASWTAITTSAGSSGFTSNTSTAFIFDTGAFVFNGGSSITTPFAVTTSFAETGQLDLEISYLVGDPSNGGTVPELDENLRIQYSNNGGASYFVASDVWLGGSSNIWNYATTSLSGQIFTSVGSPNVNGIGANFTTNLTVGDRLYFLTSMTTTAYTVTNIIDNSQIQISPSTTNSLRSSTAIVGRTWGPDNTLGSSISRIFGVNTQFTSLSRDNIISIGSSTTTTYTIINIVDNTTIDVSPQLVDSYVSTSVLTGTLAVTTGSTSIVGTATLFSSELTTGTVIRLINSGPSQTSYTIVNINSNTSISVSPAAIFDSSGLTGFTISSTGVSVSSYLQTAGVPFFKVLPASQQFQTTSITVYGPGPETSITVRIIKSTIGPNTANAYAINNLRATAFRYQDTTGTVNIHVSVSSGTNLYLSDSDYIDITTIGTI